MAFHDRVRAYLQTIAPQRATNGDIRQNLGVKHHQQVFQATRLLMESGQIHGRRYGNEWEFWVNADSHDVESPAMTKAVESPKRETPAMNSRTFEELARNVMSRHFGAPLRSGRANGVPKIFDMVSADGQIVGDAKYYTLVGGERLPPAKFSVIAEHVWLLEKTKTQHRFLVFGNEIRVPQMWLARYRELIDNVDFFFLTKDGGLTLIDR